MRENNAHTRIDSERARPRARLRDAAESVCLCELWVCSVHAGRGAAVLSPRLSVQVGLERLAAYVDCAACSRVSQLAVLHLSRYGSIGRRWALWRMGSARYKFYFCVRVGLGDGVAPGSRDGDFIHIAIIDAWDA